MAKRPEPVYVLIPGSAQTAAHYGLLIHNFMKAGHAIQAATLPSTGGLGYGHVSAEDDAKYVRENMILPVLDVEKRDVILVMHSYSGVPGSAAAKGLGKAKRKAQGKDTSVLGQIFVACILVKGGDGRSFIDGVGGQTPPHMIVKEEENVVECPDPTPFLYQDVDPTLAKAAVMSCLNPRLSAWKTPAQPASWDDQEDFGGRLAYIHCLKDQNLPMPMQQMMLQGTGQEFITKDINTGHSPQLVQPEELRDLVVELGQKFQKM